MVGSFHDLPEAIANTGTLSDRLSFVMKDMGYEFPHYPIREHETMDSFLRKRTFEGVARRYGCKASAKLQPKAIVQASSEVLFDLPDVATHLQREAQSIRRSGE